MVQVYPDVACLYALQRLIDNDVKFIAYTNNYTPDEDTVIGDLTLGTNMETIVAAADFSIQEINGHIASVVAAPISIVNDTISAQNVYGVVAVDDADETKILAVARLDDPILPLDPSDSFAWLPMLSALWSQ